MTRMVTKRLKYSDTILQRKVLPHSILQRSPSPYSAAYQGRGLSPKGLSKVCVCMCVCACACVHVCP